MNRLHIRLWAAIVLVAIFFGGLITHSLPVPGILQLPPAALLAVVALLAALPFLITRWKTTLAIFFIWIMFEDLIRKMAGNDLAVYFVKDFIFAILIVGMLADPKLRGSFKTATGSSRLWLFLLMAWAAVMCIPTAFQDWRLPLLGFRLDFLYVPLVAAGWFVCKERESLRNALLGLSVIGALASAVGIAQAVIGPTFLAPSVATPGLENLVTIRTGVGGAVYRPTGPFVDPGRYAALAGVTLAIALCAFLVTKGWRRYVALACAASAAGGVWISGGRATFLLAATVVTVAIVAPAYAERRPTIARAVPVAAITMSVLIVLAVLVPSLFTNRFAWYKSTLSPGSSQSEWTGRWVEYTSGTFNGVYIGGVIGQGTGEASVGKQYLFNAATDYSASGLYNVEAGYGAVAIEWGVIGLVLWIIWTFVWITRMVSSSRAARPDPVAAVGIVLTTWIFIFLVLQFFSGLQTFQNYITNAYFWFLSGCIFALPSIARLAEEKQEEPVEPQAIPKELGRLPA